MKKLLTFLLLNVAFITISFADHGPRIQFIHNSAAESVETVDVWISYANAVGVFPPSKLIDGFEYKQATEFNTFGLIYGDLIFYITPVGSSDTTNYFLKKSFGPPQIDYEETFVICLTGDSEDNFDMILTEGKESTFSNNTSVKVFHGSTDIPSINIQEISIPAGLLFENLSYGEAQGYTNLNSVDYVLQIETTEGSAIGNFSFPLSLFNGTPVFVAASGYLDPNGNNSSNSIKLLVVKPNGAVYEIGPNQGGAAPRLQIIHNSAAEAASELDVWITDSNGSIKLLSDFRYKEATPYIDAPTTFTVSIAGAGSVDTTNAVIHKNFILTEGMSYAVIAAGDPGTNFNLFATEGSETATTQGNTDVKIFHGSVGAPVVDIDEVGIPAGRIVDDLGFGQAQGFLSLSAIDYDLQVLTQSGIGAAEFSVPLSGFADDVLIVAATGYLDTIGETPNNPFKLIAVTPSGQVIEIDPKQSLTPARIQIIHNSATPYLDSIDLYFNNIKIFDNFAFRTATSYIEVPGATEFTIDVDVKTSLDNSFPIHSEKLVLASGRTHTVIASGVYIFGSESYTPLREFDLISIMDTREQAMDENMVDVLVFHGATDVAGADINELTIPVPNLVSDIEYATTQGYLQLEPQTYELELALTSSGYAVNKYIANLSSLEGQAIIILASGFVNPIKNNSGADFGLWVALPEGGPLVELPSITSVDESLIDVESVMIYPNPTNGLFNVNFNMQQESDVNIYLSDLKGHVVYSKSYGSNFVTNHSESININSLSSGLYLLTIHAGKSVITRKIQLVN